MQALRSFVRQRDEQRRQIRARLQVTISVVIVVDADAVAIGHFILHIFCGRFMQFTLVKTAEELDSAAGIKLV